MKRFIILAIILFAIFQNSYSQVSSGGVPISFLDQSLLLVKSPQNTIFLPNISNSAAMLYADSVSFITNKNYYGIGTGITIDIKNSATEINYNNTNYSIHDSGKVWLLFIESTSAYGMQFYFNQFNLPDGAMLNIFNEDKSTLLGSFSSLNNPDNQNEFIKFATQPIKGNKITIEYFEPYNVDFEGELSIANIIHCFYNIPEPGNSAWCHQDVDCYSFLNDEKKSVCLILIYNAEEELTSTCSGFLINNNNNVIPDGTPYLLSAGHCVPENIGTYGYNTWVFVFNHQMTSCGGSNLSSNFSFTGADLLSTKSPYSSDYDYLLLKLKDDKEIVKSFPVCYAGWSINEAQGPPYIGIHHPAGDVKKYSLSGINNMTDFSGYYWYPPTNTILDSYFHWHIDWTIGAAESGSSGSPLFNSNGKSIGILSYGYPDYDYCDFSEITGYFKFSKAWTDGNFKNWLDKNNTGVESVNTYCPIAQEIPNPNDNCDAYSIEFYELYGFSINNKSENVVEVCLDEDIELRAIAPTDCDPWFLIAPKTITKGWFNHSDCNYLQSLDPVFFYWNNWLMGSCQATFLWLFVSLTLCDGNLDPIDTEFGKWFSVHDYKLHTINLYDFIPSPYITLASGQYYKIKIAPLTAKGWTEHSKYIHFYAPQRHVNSVTNLNHNVYGDNIIISNTIVNNPIEVVASNSIRIMPGSSLKSGRCYLDETIDCLMFNNKNSIIVEDPNRNYSTEEGFIYYSQNELINNEINIGLSDNISIAPNPFCSSFSILLFLEESTETEIFLTNIYGRNVAQIHSGMLHKGENLIETTNFHISSGIYFCIIQTKKFRKVLKIVKS